jgi:hypothetical protein
LKKIGTVVLLNKRMQGDKKWHLKIKGTRIVVIDKNERRCH